MCEINPNNEIMLKLLSLIEAMPIAKSTRKNYSEKLKLLIEEEADIVISEHKQIQKIIKKSIKDGLDINTISSITGLTIDEIQKIK